MGGGELHRGYLDVDRTRVDRLWQRQRHVEVFHLTGEEEVVDGLSLLDVAVVCAEVNLLGDVLGCVLGRALQLAGVWYAAVADEVVDAPGGEQLVHYFDTAHGVLAVGDGRAAVDDVVGIDAQTVELHADVDFHAHRLPQHVALALPCVLILACLDLVDGQLVLANGDGLAFQVGGTGLGGRGVGDVHHVRALEIFLRQQLNEGKVLDVGAVAHEGY